MEFLKEIPKYWLCLIGFGAYGFIGFLVVLGAVMTGYATDKDRAREWRDNLNPSIDESDHDRQQRLCINVMFWLWPWFVGVVFPIYFLAMFTSVFRIVFLPGITYEKLVTWKNERKERQKKAIEKESLPECIYCHKRSGTLTQGDDPPCYYHEDCRREVDPIGGVMDI